jgi:hypothetical protein
MTFRSSHTDLSGMQNALMRRFDEAYERALMAIATRASGRAIVAIAVTLYGGIGLALPLALGWSVPWLVSMNITGTLLAGTILLLWFAVRWQAASRRHLVEWTGDLRLLDAQEFEWLVGEVFRREGWKVEETGRQDGPDGGIDLIVTRQGEKRIVQCKRWTAKWVGVDDVRSFAGAVTREGLRPTAGTFVTLSDFTEQARKEAKSMGLTLLDNRDLYERVEKVRRPDACPICQAPMLLDRSPRGWWFRCVTSGCTGKRDLGRDPARAVDLLTQPPG